MTDKQLWQYENDIESVFRADLFDLEDWLTTSKTVPGLDRDNRIAAGEIGGQPIQDGFFSLFKAAPTLADPGQRKLSPLAKLMQRGMETPNWQQLREHTVGQQIGAGIGAKHFWQNVIANLPDDVKEAARQAHRNQQQADQADQHAADLQTLANLLNAAGQTDQAGEVEAQAQEQQWSADKFQQAADAAFDNLNEALDANEAQITAAMNNAAAAASDKAEDANAYVKSFSLAAGGDPQHVDPATAQAAMQALRQNKNLLDLAEMLGWARRMVRGEWRKSTKGNRNMTGYKTHELQPATMATSERIAMVSSNAAIRTDFMRRVVENAVVHVDYDGEEKQGRGPMILVRDESGSMTGQPHALAVALEWALLEIARRDNREFYCIPFSGTGQFSVWHAPTKGQSDADGLLAHLSHFYGVGTEPQQPIKRALEIIDDQDLHADVLVLTDDVFDTPSAEFVDICKAIDAKIVTVTIGGTDRNAAMFSDRVVAVGDLVGDRERLRAAVSEIV